MAKTAESNGSQLAERMRAAWKRSGLTQKDIAERMGLKNYQQVGAWLNGRKVPETTNLIRFAEAVEVPVEELMSGITTTNSDPLLQLVSKYLSQAWPQMRDGEKAAMLEHLIQCSYRGNSH